MKKTVIAGIVLVSLLVGLGIGLVVSHKAKPPVLVSRTDPPKIRFEESIHDLGTIQEGIEIPFVFKIHNMGGEPLIIKDVSSSCGCTLLNLKDKVIEAGKVGELEAVMDTTLKQGFVRKSIDIFSNDPVRPKTQVYLMANVMPSASRLSDLAKKVSLAQEGGTSNPNDPHAMLGASEKSKIFMGQCATCHVAMGKGKMGAELFKADCAMCHGQGAEGAVGPALVPGDFKDPAYVKRIQKVIRYGSDSNLSMPGFLKSSGGPLTEAEIDSLVQYLKTKSEQVSKK